MEVIGLAATVLEAIPLFLNALSTHRKALKSVSSSRRRGEQIAQLEQRFNYQFLLYRSCMAALAEGLDLGAVPDDLQTWFSALKVADIGDKWSTDTFHLLTHVMQQFHQDLSKGHTILSRLQGNKDLLLAFVLSNATQDLKSCLHRIERSIESIITLTDALTSGLSLESMGAPHRHRQPVRSLYRTFQIAWLTYLNEVLQGTVADQLEHRRSVFVQHLAFLSTPGHVKPRLRCLISEMNSAEPKDLRTMNVTRNAAIFEDASVVPTQEQALQDIEPKESTSSEIVGNKSRPRTVELLPTSPASPTEDSTPAEPVTLTPVVIGIRDLRLLHESVSRPFLDPSDEVGCLVQSNIVSLDDILAQNLSFLSRIQLCLPIALTFMFYMFHKCSDASLRDRFYFLVREDEYVLNEPFYKLRSAEELDPFVPVDVVDVEDRVQNFGFLLAYVFLGWQWPNHQDRAVNLLDMVSRHAGVLCAEMVESCLSFKCQGEQSVVPYDWGGRVIEHLSTAIVLPLRDILQIFSTNMPNIPHQVQIRTSKSEPPDADITVEDIDFSDKNAFSRLHRSALSILGHSSAKTPVLHVALLEVQDIALGLESVLDLTSRRDLSKRENKWLTKNGRMINTSFHDFLNLLSRSESERSSDAIDLSVSDLRSCVASLTSFLQDYSEQFSLFDPLETASTTAVSDTIVSIFEDEGYFTVSTATSVREQTSIGGRELSERLVALLKDRSITGELLPNVLRKEGSLDTTRSILIHTVNAYAEELLGQVYDKPGFHFHERAAIMIRLWSPNIVNMLTTDLKPTKTSNDLEGGATDKVTNTVMLDKGDLRFAAPGVEDEQTLLKSTNPSRWVSFVDKSGRTHRSSSSDTVVFTLVKDWLISGRAFGRLRLALRHFLEQDPDIQIREEVDVGLSSHQDNISPVRINIQWGLRQFIREELGGVGVLSQVLTVTGKPPNVFADSCRRYMSWRWPQSTFNLLEVMNQVLRIDRYESRDLTLQIELRSSSDPTSDDIFEVFFAGTKHNIYILIEQLAWLSIVMRVNNSQVLSCSGIEFMWTEYGEFDLRPGKLDRVPQQPGTCWYPLLGRALIATGFTIPEREEVGMELPLQALVHLSRASAEMTIGNQVALFGSSTLLFPVHKRADDDQPDTCIQWHAATGQLPQASADLFRSDISWLATEDVYSLASSRTIIGYCSRASINLGTQDFRYDLMQASGLSHDQTKPGVKIKNITAGTSGLGIFGVQVVTDIIYPASMEISPEITRYDDILDVTRCLSVILLDVSDQRAWLVPAHSMLLHMAHCWIQDRDDLLPGVSLGFTDSSSDDARATENIFRQDYNIPLKHLLDDDTDFCVRDLVKQIWRDLSGCMIANKQLRRDERGALLAGADHLRVWDLTDFVRRDKPLSFRLREQKIPSSGCGWEVLAQNLDTMILACRNVGDVIQRGPGVQICDEWHPIPSDRMYLTVSTRCMRGLDSDNDQTMVVADGVYWDPPSDNILEECRHGRRNACQRRLQKFVSNAPRRRNRAFALPHSGAVVFGVRVLRKTPVSRLRKRNDQSDDRTAASVNEPSWYKRLIRRR